LFKSRYVDVSLKCKWESINATKAAASHLTRSRIMTDTTFVRVLSLNSVIVFIWLSVVTSRAQYSFLPFGSKAGWGA